MLPNFFIVGAMRSGTTSFYRYLAEQPKIFMCKYKEPAFFSDFTGNRNADGLWTKTDEIPKDRHLNLSQEEYEKLFEDVKDEIGIGEASIQYLLDPLSSKLIKKEVPNAKILIFLRNPIERTFSHYLATRIRMTKEIPFREIIQDHSKEIDIEKPTRGNILIWGLYSKQVKRYLDVFGKDNVKIFIYEEVFPNRVKETVEEILNFLGIKEPVTNFKQERYQGYYTLRNSIFKNRFVKKTAKGLIPRKILDKTYQKIRVKDSIKPEISKDDREFLMEFFKNDINELEKILGRSLPWIK